MAEPFLLGFFRFFLVVGLAAFLRQSQQTGSPMSLYASGGLILEQSEHMRPDSRVVADLAWVERAGTRLPPFVLGCLEWEAQCSQAHVPFGRSEYLQTPLTTIPPLPSQTLPIVVGHHL